MTRSPDWGDELVDQLVEANRRIVPLDEVTGRRIWNRLQVRQRRDKRTMLSFRLLLAAILIFVTGGTVGAAMVAYYKGTSSTNSATLRAQSMPRRPRAVDSAMIEHDQKAAPSARGNPPTALPPWQAGSAAAGPEEAPPTIKIPRPALQRVHTGASARLPAPTAETTAEPPAAATDVASPEQDDESSSLAGILVALRRERAPRKALEMIESHLAAWPSGRFKQEAEMAKVEALLAAQDERAALAWLKSRWSLDGPRGYELMVLRGRLRAKYEDCGAALRDLAPVLDHQAQLPPHVLEPALATKANCEVRLTRVAQAQETLRRYIQQFPVGPFAPDARRLLQDMR